MIACIHQLVGSAGGRTFYVCNHPDAPSFKRKVSEACCTECPLRQTGKTYRPLWPTCEHRKKESRTEPCGCKYEIAICQHPQSEHNGKQVFPRVCRACPLKKD